MIRQAPSRVLDELARRQCALRQQREHVGIDRGACGFDQVERERGAATLVGVEDPETGVQAQRVTGKDRFSLKQCVQIIQHRAGRVDREPRTAGEERGALPEHRPVRGQPAPPGGRERDRERRPRLPVRGCGLSLGREQGAYLRGDEVDIRVSGRP